MANTTNFNWATPDDTDLVKDGAAAIRTLGSSIDTSFVDLKGGTTGQILSKASNTDLDYTWITNDVGDITNVGVTAPITGGGSSGSVTIGIDDGTTTQKGAVQLEDSTSSTSTTKAATPNSVKSAYDLANAAIPKSLVDAAGDLIYATADNTPARLALGTAGQVLKVNSGATAPEWGAAPASGLTLITRQTVTNAADTGSSFAGVFTSTYDSYLVIIENMVTPGSAQNVQMQLKYSTNTNQTSDYYGNNAYALYNASSFSFINTNNASAYNLTSAGNSADTRFSIWINGVGNASERATWSGTGFDGYNNRIVTFAGETGVSNTWTGLNFLLASGNITITASVYGLAK